MDVWYHESRSLEEDLSVVLMAGGRRPMDLQRFDLNLLVALDALLTEKNLTRAGVRLNLSQSAMSASLARLRDFFHDELLVLAGRTMVLTPLAEGLSQPVRDVLLQVQATIATKPRFDPAVSTRHFTIALSDYVTNVLMIDFLRGARNQAPAITFELRRVGKRASEDLESGTLDFLIAPEPYVSRAHPREVLFEETHSCIVWTNNRRVGSKISPEQYLALGHVLVQLDEAGPNYDERTTDFFVSRPIIGTGSSIATTASRSSAGSRTACRTTASAETRS
jgi:LysR family nod box-dependent transcriptional activator